MRFCRSVHCAIGTYYIEYVLDTLTHNDGVLFHFVVYSLGHAQRLHRNKPKRQKLEKRRDNRNKLLGIRYT